MSVQQEYEKSENPESDLASQKLFPATLKVGAGFRFERKAIRPPSACCTVYHHYERHQSGGRRPPSSLHAHAEGWQVWQLRWLVRFGVEVLGTFYIGRFLGLDFASGFLAAL